jgi:pyruvate,water dikinase
VTEAGGPLSHGAVTAREMRLPAVMGVRDATRRLSNGQIVAVDGSTGTVALQGAGNSAAAQPLDAGGPRA